MLLLHRPGRRASRARRLRLRADEQALRFIGKPLRQGVALDGRKGAWHFHSATSTSSDAEGRLHHAAGGSGAPGPRGDGAEGRGARGTRRRGRRPRRRRRPRRPPGERPRSHVSREPEARARRSSRWPWRASSRPPRRGGRRAHVPDLRRSAAPLVRPLRIPLVVWFTHWRASRLLQAAERVSTAVTSVDERSFPLSSKKLRAIGHGIDVGEFPCARPREGSGTRLLALGRYSTAKARRRARRGQARRLGRRAPGPRPALGRGTPPSRGSSSSSRQSSSSTAGSCSPTPCPGPNC